MATDSKASQPGFATQTFSYQTPELGPRRINMIMARTDQVKAAVQVFDRVNGAEILHSHKGVDTFWLVLKGRVRFHGPADLVYGEFGPMEGIVTTRGLRYFFECVSDEPVEMLQVAAFDPRVASSKNSEGAVELLAPTPPQYFERDDRDIFVEKRYTYGS